MGILPRYAALLLLAGLLGTGLAAVPTRLEPPFGLSPAGEMAGFAAYQVGEGRFDLSLSGRRFTSRDAIERDFLLATARFALSRGARWFRLETLPGESGEAPGDGGPAGGVGVYPAWRPHWSYFRPVDGWQPWHPEWGGPFWTDFVPGGDVESWQVQAMVRLETAEPNGDPLAFDAGAVIGDLEASSKH